MAVECVFVGGTEVVIIQRNSRGNEGTIGGRIQTGDATDPGPLNAGGSEPEPGFFRRLGRLAWFWPVRYFFLIATLVAMTFGYGLMRVARSEARPLKGMPGLEGFLVRDPFDARPVEPRRLVVLFVHGTSAYFMQPQPVPHYSWARFLGRLAFARAAGSAEVENLEVYFLNHRPARAMSEMGEGFAALLDKSFPDRDVVVVAHSAGAMLPRYAQKYTSRIRAVVGVGAAHGGLPGVSLMFANDEIKERVGEYNLASIRMSYRNLGWLPDSALASYAWDAQEGDFSHDDLARYEAIVQTLPPISYPRYDHWGRLEHWEEPGNPASRWLRRKTEQNFPNFASLFMMSELARRRWESIGSWSEKWATGDGIVVPYAIRGPVLGTSTSYPNRGHVGLLFAGEVVDAVMGRLETLSRTAD